MKRILVGVGGILFSTWIAQAQVAPGANPVGNLAAQRAVLDQYCAGCHNQKVKSGGLALDQLDLTRAGEQAETLEKIVRKLRAGMMPPLGLPRPPQAVYQGLTVALETEIDRAAAGRPNLVAPGLHRVNRTEYSNAIRALLGLDIDAAAFLPADDSSFGFDNVASGLGVSPALVDGYTTAAIKLSRLALGHELTPGQKRYMVTDDYSQERHVDGLPFGTRGGMLVKHYFPADGEYVLSWGPVRRNTGGLYGGERKGEQLEVLLDGERIKLYDLDTDIPQNTSQEKNEIRLKVGAGLHAVGLTFLATTYVPHNDVNRHYQRSVIDGSNIEGFTFYPQASWLLVSGPFGATRPSDTPSRRKLLACKPATNSEELPCAKKILSGLARQAFRRPVTDSDMETMLSVYQKGRNTGDFENGIERGLQFILAHPEFVFRSEIDPANVKPGQAYRLSDLELASRLSFFLWSSVPDEELVSLAAQGKLKDPLVLERQVKRMLADPRSHELVKNFTGQWLQLRSLPSSAPITDLFPDFDDNLRQAFRSETEMFFESILREDRSVVDLLTADYTFVNERLARHYGIPNIYGSQFRRVTLDATLDVRRGLLGKGSIQLVTSIADRTSPVQRGKWVMMNILGVIPPDPPPNVPPLKEAADGGAVALEQTMRERMEQHRANAVCASCHKMMDPIGFALENFDAVGKWRTTQFGRSLDASGQLTDGSKLTGPASLRQALVRYSPQFVQTLTENLLTYALGRGVEYKDMPLVRSIVHDAARSDYRFVPLVMGIVKSAPFQMNMKAREAGSLAQK
jgi:uncharacterized protein DUF1592/uncharacterized protein DUF1588/uncharacterized protein DUF1585/uncharacterized protein DUF1587/uncharacterized protein DUF1595/cytochrome c